MTTGTRTGEGPRGVAVRRYERQDGTVTESFTVRFKEADGTKRRRSFDTLQDAMDFQARRRSAKRWRPEELRQEQAGRRTLGDFFAQWWVEQGMVELKRSTLVVYRYLWEAHAEPRLAAIPLREIDAQRVVVFRGELLAAGGGPQSVVKTMSMLQRVFRDAMEYGEASSNPFKAVRKPTPGPVREAHPLTPLQVERLAADLAARGYRMSAVMVRTMAYTGLRPQELLALHWYAIREQTLLVELANADGELERLKNRKRSKKRSRTVDLMAPVREDLKAWRRESAVDAGSELVFPHQGGRLWREEHYRTWRRRIFVPSAGNVGLPTRRPYDLRHTWVSLRVAERRLTVAKIAEQLGDKISTMLDSYTHVLHEWRGRRPVSIEREIQRARAQVEASVQPYSAATTPQDSTRRRASSAGARWVRLRFQSLAEHTCPARDEQPHCGDLARVALAARAAAAVADVCLEALAGSEDHGCGLPQFAHLPRRYARPPFRRAIAEPLTGASPAYARSTATIRTNSSPLLLQNRSSSPRSTSMWGGSPSDSRSPDGTRPSAVPEQAVHYAAFVESVDAPGGTELPGEPCPARSAMMRLASVAGGA